MARLPTTREIREVQSTTMTADQAESAAAMARQWLRKHPRPVPAQNDPFPEDRLTVAWQTEHAHGAIRDPWTLLEIAIADLGAGKCIASHIWLIRYITGRVP